MSHSGLLPSTRVRALVALTLLGLAAGVATAAPVAGFQTGDGSEYTIGVDVDLVVFNVTVADKNGRHISGLTAHDFRVYDQNRLQNLTLFDAENVPATVGLVIDNSGSMREKRADVIKAALAFAAATNSEDELFVLNFNEKVYTGLPSSLIFTSNYADIRSALLRMAPAGLTALYDALAAGLDYLKKGRHDRKSLVVLSDGGDNASVTRLDDLLDLAKVSSATVYTIGIYDETDRDRNPRVLRKIAALTGGRAYFPDSVKALEDVWLDIAGGIRSQYTLGYHPSNPSRDGLFRKVKITAGRNGGQGLRVTTREGYLAPKANSSTGR